MMIHFWCCAIVALIAISLDGQNLWAQSRRCQQHPDLCRKLRKPASQNPSINSNDLEDEMLEPEIPPAAKSSLQSESTPAGMVTFTTYLNFNASHPALSTKVTNQQKAFIETPRKAIFVIPSNTTDVNNQTSEENKTPNPQPNEPARIN